MHLRLLTHLAIVAFAAVFGLALAKVTAGDPWFLSLGAAGIAVIAIGIAALFARPTASFEQDTSPRKLLGMRIATVGGLVALSGWVITVLLSANVGFYVVVLGFVVGFSGFVTHYYVKLSA